MCEKCEAITFFLTVGDVDDREPYAENYVCGNTMFLDAYAGGKQLSSHVKINYCPFCGRKLDEDVRG